jgi:hypothetical protein
LTPVESDNVQFRLYTLDYNAIDPSPDDLTDTNTLPHVVEIAAD